MFIVAGIGSKQGDYRRLINGIQIDGKVYIYFLFPIFFFFLALCAFDLMTENCC